MRHKTRSGGRAGELIDAFEKDGYNIKNFIEKSGKIGMIAEHKTARNYDTGSKKRAYYLEGSSYEMGYMMGLLAEKEIEAMAVDFADDIVFAFIFRRNNDRANLLGEILVSLLYALGSIMHSELPQDIRDEIHGLYDGCRESNPNTRVTIDHLIVLNCGIDILCSLIYSGNFLLKKIKHAKSDEFRVPIMCNAFSVFGAAAGNNHFFGRDFMFPTANVFQNVAAHIIYNPVNAGDIKSFPFVTISAPGMTGSIAGVNAKGVALGVDMAPAGNCSPEKIGTNSLLMSRLCLQYGGTAEEAVKIIRDTTRGVSWNYVIADGGTDRSCVVEAGSSERDPDFLNYPPCRYKSVLPDKKFVKSHRTAEYQKGMMVRWNDYKYDTAYLQFNKALWKHPEKDSPARQLHSDAFNEKGYINRNGRERNCPSVFYFAPQRETSNNILIVTNHFIIPEMRFYSMHLWTSMIASRSANDVQWRYDELNNQLLSALEEKGAIDYDTARQLIDFLAPYGRYPGYYAGNPRSADSKELRIEGCTSLFDLKKKTIESHFGYYCDEWVKISLHHYV